MLHAEAQLFRIIYNSFPEWEGKISLPTIQTAVNAGEWSPELFGRTDLDKYRRACSTLRNFFASYRGGASTRAGTLFCGICKQGNLNSANLVPPPRNIPFQFNVTQGIVIEAGRHYFRFLSEGGYITQDPFQITNVTLGPVEITTSEPHGFQFLQEVFVTGIKGIPQLDNRTYLVNSFNTNSFTLVNPLDGQLVTGAGFPAYEGGGTVASIYEVFTPYAAEDLPSLKFAQSADVMSFTHPNYPPQDLVRITASQWTLSQTTFGTAIDPPAAINIAATSSGLSTPSFWYQFIATAVDASTGEESAASPIGYVLTVDQSTEAGTMFVTCDPVAGAGSYNFYQGPVSFSQLPSPGSIFGYVGSSFGPSFTDTNVTPDFSVSPPLHVNPFATSSIIAVTMTANGSSYNPTTTTVAVTSPIGENPSLVPVIVSGAIQWVSVQSGGAGFTGGEAVIFTDASGSGSGATATLDVGPATGTYPGAVAYFQQRRFYANTNNNPDTYYASQPGAFTNMDTSLPVVDSDAIIGSPWSQQVNGIQWMVNMPGGLVILTGLGAWQLSGGATGIATAAAVTPSNQVANPQAYNGVSPTVPPIVINYDILYVQERGSIVRNLSYNYFVNIYTGTDMTVLSNHLFQNFQIIQWAWAEEPYKLVWCVRDDGILLCLTILKEQEVYAWSRHDTNGLFQSVCTVSEPPVNAPYFVVKRLIQNDGNPCWAYMQERMDDRLWHTLGESWCVDCGLAYPQNEPNATITLSSSSGVATLQPPTLIYGGANYSAQTFAEILDPTGSGAQLTLTITMGVITAVALSGTLTGYSDPKVRVIDPTGVGGNAAISITLVHLSTLFATAPVFTGAPGLGAVGDVIRMNGRIMRVVQYTGSTQLEVDVVRDDGLVIPNDPTRTAIPGMPLKWSIAAPVTTVYGLNHLEGMTVSVLADGIIITPQQVVNGSITLPQPATQIVAGLPFTAQLQTLYLDIPGGVTVQGRRKEIDSVVVRLFESGVPFEVGANQPDASVQPNMVPVEWSKMTKQQTPISTSDPIQPFEFFTGDIFTDVFDQVGFDKGQLAIQQSDPVPVNVLALIPWARIQDDPDV